MIPISPYSSEYYLLTISIDFINSIIILSTQYIQFTMIVFEFHFQITYTTFVILLFLYHPIFLILLTLSNLSKYIKSSTVVFDSQLIVLNLPEIIELNTNQSYILLHLDHFIIYFIYLFSYFTLQLFLYMSINLYFIDQVQCIPTFNHHSLELDTHLIIMRFCHFQLLKLLYFI